MHATNVAGLGSTNVVLNILQSLSNNDYLKEKSVILYLPEIDFWKINSNFNPNWKIFFVKRSKNRFLQLIFRLFEILFTSLFIPKCINLIVLGDFPIRVKTNQIILLHNPHLVNYKNGLNFFTIHRFLFKLNHKFANHCIVQTELMKDKLVSYYPFFTNKITSILMPAKNIFNNDIPTIINSNELNLFYPASFYKHKNHILINKILNSTSFFKIKNVKFHLTITVQNWLNISKLSNLKNDNINFLGTITDLEVKEYYKKFGILFFPSIDETLGLPLIEAMKMGSYIICSDLPYAKILCGTEAIYFNPDDAGSVIDAILDLKNKISKNELPDWSDALAKFPHNWKDYVDQFIKVLK